MTRVDRQEQRKPYWRDADEEQEEIEEYQDRHRSFADRVERLLMQMVTLGLVALVLVQAFQINRFTNRLVAMEGVTLSEVSAWSRTVSDQTVQPVQAVQAVSTTAALPMRLRVVLATRRSAPGARLLVNGKAAGDFRTGSVTVDVAPGQVLVIDGSAYPEALTFRVVERTGLDSPALGAVVTTRGDQQRLGVVRQAGR